MNASEIEARRWFLQAQADLVVVFSQGSRVVWGHSVRELARQCEVHDPALGGLAGDAALLDQFYIPTRYPNGLPAPAVPSETYTAAQAGDAGLLLDPFNEEESVDAAHKLWSDDSLRDAPLEKGYQRMSRVRTGDYGAAMRDIYEAALEET